MASLYGFIPQNNLIMFRLSLLLLGVLFIDTLLTQTYIADNNNQYHNAVNLTFHDKVLNCKIENRGGPLYDWEKCLMPKLKVMRQFYVDSENFMKKY